MSVMSMGRGRDEASGCELTAAEAELWAQDSALCCSLLVHVPETFLNKALKETHHNVIFLL